MTRCPSCQYPVPDDRERAGARCPSCHDPLYEPAGRISRPAREEEPACAVHAGRESVGVCGACGQSVCETCRTRWYGQILCAACVDRALTAEGVLSAAAREHRRQAVTAVVLAGGAWLVLGLSLFVLSRPVPAGQVGVIVTFLGFLAMALDVLLGAAAAGTACAALRGGAAYRGLALVGLILGGGCAGLLLGVAALGLWQY